MAMNYADDMDSAHELVCQLLRKVKYNNTLWTIVAGSIDNDFISYVQNTSPTIYNYMTQIVGTNDLFIYLPDGSIIDIDHLIATLNVIIYHSTIIVDNIEITEEMLDILSGWGMDMRSMVPFVIRDTDDLDSFSDLYNTSISYIGHDDYKFSYPDLYADLDAANMGELFVENDSVYNVLRNYYFNDLYKERYTLFVNSFSSTGIMEPSYFDVYDQILEIVSSISVNIIYPYKEVDNSGNDTENIINLSSTQKAAIAAAFTDFLFDKYNIENEG